MHTLNTQGFLVHLTCQLKFAAFLTHVKIVIASPTRHVTLVGVSSAVPHQFSSWYSGGVEKHRLNV